MTTDPVRSVDADGHTLAVSLLILRLSLVVFMAVWVAEKFVAPGTTIAILGYFYGLEAPIWAAYTIGVVQAAMLILFALGLAKLYSYGFFVVIHFISMAASWQPLITPYDGSNHLFHAGIPALAAFVVLFLLRERDRMWSVG